MQSQQTELKGKVDIGSLVFAGIFIIIFSLLVVLLRIGVNNDTIFGMARKLRARQFSIFSIKVFTVIEIAIITVVPIFFAIAWSTYLMNKTKFGVVHVLAVVLSTLFI